MPSDSEGPSAPAIARSKVAEDQRARLLAATVEVAGERGWDGLTLADVVTRAGVSKRTVYDLYEDKLACFLAAARETIDQVSELVLAAYRRAGGGRAGLAAGVGELLRFCGENPRTARVYLVEIAAAGPAGAALWREHMDEMSRRADCVLGKLRDDLPAHSGSMAVGGVYTLVQGRVLAGQTRQLPELTPDVTAALWTILGLGWR
jgi:AcrR family transcriptional regulator